MKLFIILMLCGQPQYYLAIDGDQTVYATDITQDNAEFFYNLLSHESTKKYKLKLHDEGGFHCA